jgi:prepilin-type N-terminal cleavage/methylation domain-containing protein
MKNEFHQQPANRFSTRGFTLVEVLIALTIFSIGILAVFALQMRSINQNAAARIQGEATNVGALTMERLIALPYLHDDLDENGNPHRQMVGPYEVEWRVRVPKPGDADYAEYEFVTVKMIDVSVSSANPNARPINLSFIKGAGT